LTARAFGSLAQHSGVFVLMVLCGLRVMTTRKLQAAEVVSSPATETQQVSRAADPKAARHVGAQRVARVPTLKDDARRVTFSRSCSLSGVKMRMPRRPREIVTYHCWRSLPP
jgi:hypothetical protein